MKGFTLVEVLISTLLLTIVLGATIIPFVNLQVFQQESQISSDMEQNLQYLLNVMDKEIRSGTEPSYNPSTKTFSFTIDEIGVTYTFDDSSNPHTFERNLGGNVVDYGSTDQFQIENVAFDVEEQDSTSSGRVTVSITAKPDVGRSDEQTIHVQSTTIMRNR